MNNFIELTKQGVKLLVNVDSIEKVTATQGAQREKGKCKVVIGEGMIIVEEGYEDVKNKVLRGYN